MFGLSASLATCVRRWSRSWPRSTESTSRVPKSCRFWPRSSRTGAKQGFINFQHSSRAEKILASSREKKQSSRWNNCWTKDPESAGQGSGLSLGLGEGPKTDSGPNEKALKERPALTARRKGWVGAWVHSSIWISQVKLGFLGHYFILELQEWLFPLGLFVTHRFYFLYFWRKKMAKSKVRFLPFI